MNKIIVIFFVIVFVDAIIKKCNIFDMYIEGTKEVFTIMIPIFKTLMAYMLFVGLLKSSGFIEIVSIIFNTIISMFHIPIDIYVMALLRPMSANASLSFLYYIYELFGVDHSISLLATLIQCGSDTTLYVVSLYFSSLHITNTRYAVVLGLFLDVLAVFLSIIFYLNFIV